MQILEKRYFNKALKETSWEQLVDRVVNSIWGNDKDKDAFRQMILNTYFVPNSPCLVNAGRAGAGLSACYVVDFPDTTEGIYKTKLDFALIARKGGGCGTSLEKIRPEGSFVSRSSHGYAGGPLKFANTISHDMDAMTQSGFRSMAIMFTQSVYHPDIIKFITAKQEEGVIANANMSVLVDDKFMQAVIDDKEYWTEFNGKQYQKYRAKEVFDLMIEGAWRNGEPGILFRDRINESPYSEVGEEIFSTNPCSEQPLPPNGVCNLGSLDLTKFIDEYGQMNYEKLSIAVDLAVRFLDKVVDKTTYPTKDIEKWSKENRPIGLGIMGYADYLLMRKIAYGSKEALDELGNIMFWIHNRAIETSQKLAGRFKLRAPKMARKLKHPRRNITILTIAPTGTISLIAGCSSGIEPVYSEITVRSDKTGIYTFVNNLASEPYFRCAVSSNGAVEVTWEEHIKTLATAQRFVDSGVSKTINFPSGAHRETMAKAAILAWELGCKGLAMYRNSSRKVEVLTPKNLQRNKCPVCNTEMFEIDGKERCPSCKKEDLIEKTLGSYDD